MGMNSFSRGMEMEANTAGDAGKRSAQCLDASSTCRDKSSHQADTQSRSRCLDIIGSRVDYQFVKLSHWVMESGRPVRAGSRRIGYSTFSPLLVRITQYKKKALFSMYLLNKCLHDRLRHLNFVGIALLHGIE